MCESELLLQAWAGFEVKQKQYARAHELFQQALGQEQAAGTVERQASLLKATGDALIRQGKPVEAGGAYQRALQLMPESPEIVVVCCLREKPCCCNRLVLQQSRSG